MRYTRYIALIVLIFATACSVDNLEPSVSVSDVNDKITVIGRAARFTDYDVATRGAKSDDESKLTSMALALFPVENGTIGNCELFQYSETAQLIFTIDRTQFTKEDIPYVMYVFANMPQMAELDNPNVDVNTITLDRLKNYAHAVTSVNIPAGGFPMIGSLGDTVTEEGDNRELILKPSGDGLPTIAGVETDILQVPLKAMFAKMSFTIKVTPDQVIAEKLASQFTLSGYTVHNVPNTVDFRSDTNDDSDVIEEVAGLAVTGFTTASGANTINFSFYVPERYLVPETTSDEYEYPFKTEDGIRGEDEIYMQRFKPLLPGEDQSATYVKLTGVYRDHQNHTYDVNYNIYLGKDNYGDFNVIRNGEYNNYVTIRGISTSDDMSDKQNVISIDHRVDIQRQSPIIINMRREALLDSHFEVRPLRVRSSGVNADGINAVKVQVVNPETTNWMRLERSFGDGTVAGSPTNASGQCIYINEDSESASYGKRRYFTYNLVDGKTPGNYDYSLVNSTEVILPISEKTECCWIYVDECTATGDDVRSGIIKVSYGSYDGTTFTTANSADYPDLDYVINQRKLFEVTYDDPNTTAVENRTYRIEYEEEYLHNFDADDSYGQTEYEGMEWGLEGIQLSYDHEALYFKAKTGDWANGIVDYFTGEVPAYYDFYIKKHDEARMADPKQVTLHEYAGYDFCNEIIETVNGVQKDNNGNAYDSDSSNNIEVLQLDAQPKSAIEYCYNKNKRNNVGIVENVEWYLPAVDEIEDIVMSKYGNNLNTYTRFLEFQDQDYWSCQPAFIQNYAHLRWTLLIFPLDYWGAFYFDDIGDSSFDKNNNTDRANIGSARSTSVKYENGVYSSTASGTNGYYSYYDASSQKYQYSGTFNGVTVGTITREEGNFPRDEKNRIRCVRKLTSSTN